MSCVPSVNAYVASQACQNHCASDIKLDNASTNCVHQSQQDKKSWWDWSGLKSKDWTGFKFIFLGHDGVGLTGSNEKSELDLASRDRHFSGSSTSSSSDGSQSP